MAVCLLAACDPSDDAATSTSTTPVSDATGTTQGDTSPGAPAFDTLPPVDRFTYPTGTDDVVVQILVRAPFGPDVPLLTVYGDGDVIAGTNEGWRSGTVSDLAIQGLLDDAESVGLLDNALVLRVPEKTGTTVSGDTSASLPSPLPPGPDFTIRFDVDGRVLEHQLDLARIERPPAIWVFLTSATTANRFDLTEPYEPDAWIACSPAGCELVPTALDTSSRPLLPHEDPGSLVGR